MLNKKCHKWTPYRSLLSLIHFKPSILVPLELSCSVGDWEAACDVGHLKAYVSR